MARVAVGGFQHETNTFAPQRATYEDFVKHDAWPGLSRGPALFDATAGINLPITGFVGAAREDGHDLVPLLWCSAEPCAHVTRDAFERVMAMLIDDLRAHAPVDAVYLDLHGAMVVEHHEDGEGEVLRRVRAAIGPAVPLVASLDFHANVTEEMVRHADALTIYRTYPHLDMEFTGTRAFHMLARLLAGEPVHKGFRKLPFLIPLTSQWTDAEPNRTLYGMVGDAVGGGVASADFAEGFPPADIADCGPGIVAYGASRHEADGVAGELARAVLAAETKFTNEILAPDEAVRLAMSIDEGRPVVLADAQDNPGAGGTADTTGLLAALVRNGARRAALGMLNDPEVAAIAHQAGVGGSFEAALGAKSGLPGHAPFGARFRVEALSDGRFLCTGPVFSGATTNLGPTALLAIEAGGSDVRVVVGSSRFQCLDQAVFKHIGVVPEAMRILAVKSTVHFRAHFDPVAARTIIVEAPGAHPCRLVGLDYRRLRKGVRLEPGGPVHGAVATP